MGICKRPRPPKPEEQELETNRWAPILRWSGLTLETVSVRVVAQRDDVEVRWRRYAFGGIPYSFGRFMGSRVFDVRPGNFFVHVDLKVTGPALTVYAEQVG